MLPAFLIDPVTLSVPTNFSKLPVYELERPRVEKKGAQVPFDPLTGYRWQGKQPTHAPLEIPQWAFLHAWAKTRFQCAVDERHIQLSALCHRQLSELALDWSPPNLRRRDRILFSLKDASESAFTSEAAEACASLFMQRREYVYWDHLPSLVSRALGKGFDHPERTRRAAVITKRLRGMWPAEEPDFIFEKENHESALMESKGIQPGQGKSAPVKTRLREALSQLRTWARHIAPSPAKSFGIATVFRETSDPVDSHLAFVDPDHADIDEQNAAFCSADWVRRGNYGSWLIGMGLVEAGEALRHGRSRERQQVRLPLAEIRGRRIAFTGYAVLDLRSPPFHMFASSLFVLGIDAEILRGLSEAIADGDAVLKVEALPDHLVDEPRWKGSIFRDGTTMGVLRRPDPFVSEEVFLL